MIELILLNYLKTKLNIPVSLEKINEPEYVLIEKTGSGEEKYIKDATVAIQSYADSLYNAALLNENVKRALLGDGIESYGILELDEINQCLLNSDYNYTDTTTKKYRYQAVFNFNYI